MRISGFALLLLIAATPALAQTGAPGKPARAAAPSVQQTYAASAQVIETASSMLNSFLTTIQQ